MKTIRNFSKLITVVAILAMVLSFASCDLFNKGGALELKSFTVDRSSVKTNYLIGEEIDFSGIKATAKYTDETLNKVYTYDELDITYDDDITATVGEKDVTVSFDDPHLNVKQEAKVTIKVTEEPVIDETEAVDVEQFEAPDGITAFNSANASAGASKPGDGKFPGEFAVGEKIYVVGNENVFKFNPTITVFDDETFEYVGLNNFFAAVEISIDVEGEYVALTKVAGENNVVEYYNGETLIATVNTYKGEYKFSADAAGAKVKISVLPDEKHYNFDGNAVVLEADIVNAYNIYEAWELALIDNDSSEDRAYDGDEGEDKIFDDAHIWDDFKLDKGIANLNVSGVVLHCDLELLADHVPAAFFLISGKDTVYTNSETGKTETIPAGTKYLRDWSEIYRRILAPNETFIIEGNFFTIDTSKFPIVPSPAVFGKEGDNDDYGSDFSNATLLKFITNDAASEEDFSDVTINNVSIIGNAARDNKIDAEENLASAGGLIFLKIFRDTSVTCNNIIGNSFFITYFPDEGAIITANNVKCYDSYQNAVFIWENSKAFFNDSYLNGAGGPVVICSSPEIGDTDVYTKPVFIANNTTIETHLTGSEIWFTAVNATTIVGEIKGLSTVLQMYQLGSFVDDGGKMNIEGLVMAEGSNAAEIIKAYNAQGMVNIDGAGMDRIQAEENANLSYIIGITQGALAYGQQMPPFFTVYDEAGAAHTVYFNGTGLVDLAGNAISAETHGALFDAFKAADTICLTQGGLSVVFEFYHAN